MLKRLIGLVVSVGILLGSLPVSAATYKSEPSDWAKAKVYEGISLGVVPKEIQGDYNKPITREEFASLFVTAVFAYQTNEMIDEPSYVTKEMYLENIKVKDYSFKDTNSEEVKLAYMMGFVNGTSNTTFSPNNKITREEAAVMLVNYNNEILSPTCFEDATKRLKDLNKVSSWAKDYVSLAWSSEYFEGVSGNRKCSTRNSKDYYITFDPKGYFTREQAIVTAMNIYKVVSKSIFMSVNIRGKINYGYTMAKLKWELTKNSVTCVAFLDGETLYEYDDEISYYWHFYSNTKTLYKDATPEHILAALAGTKQHSSPYTDEMIKCGATGVNATFDLGYAEYEMNNKNFIFQYRLKGNGTYSEGYDYYGGSKQLKATYKRIK